jgi:hypothetical protein
VPARGDERDHDKTMTIRRCAAWLGTFFWLVLTLGWQWLFDVFTDSDERTLTMAHPLTATKPDHQAIVQTAQAIPWPQILAWLETYGFTMVIQVFQLVLPLLSGKKIDVAKIIQWVQDALVALASGLPMPPLPVTP